ncbi:hypothetical protein TIFTF001_034557 [Ficus carica]|uniref:Uncharacterized protein n=1 Tax=Ficus carica TaxID=3494 RepID=A0AA88E0L5_FICCA|nr:hypothetical protein TIFTF001_034536 [Ficus carica]GMN65490.1 hypothetical protein TIFTF001_034557 [Ficus carica]
MERDFEELRSERDGAEMIFGRLQSGNNKLILQFKQSTDVTSQKPRINEAGISQRRKIKRDDMTRFVGASNSNPFAALSFAVFSPPGRKKSPVIAIVVMKIASELEECLSLCFYAPGFRFASSSSKESQQQEKPIFLL